MARITRNPHCDTNTAAAVNTARGECRCAAGHKELASAVWLTKCCARYSSTTGATQSAMLFHAIYGFSIFCRLLE